MRDPGRYGKFYISYNFLREDQQEDIRAIMGECVIVRAEYLFHRGSLEYYAISPHFDIVDPGQETPEYRPVLTRDLDGTLGPVKFERVNKEA